MGKVLKVSRKTRYVAAALVWAAVSIMLIYRGFVPHFAHIESTPVRLWTLGLAVVIGISKGIFVLSKSTARTAAWITKRPERDWIWMSFHPVLYLLIPLMIAMGYYLRRSCAATHPEWILGVYLAVGLALLVGIRGFRRAILG